MQLDNLEVEEIVIRQYIRLRLGKCRQEMVEIELVRLPYDVCLYCRQIFRREAVANRHLLAIFESIFYVRGGSEGKESGEDELGMLYLELLTKGVGNKSRALAQITLRCVLLGLALKAGSADTRLFKADFRHLVNTMRLELVLTGEQILSDALLRELKLMTPLFDALEYYQHLQRMFRKCEVVRVQRWLDEVLDVKKRKFKEKKESVLPFHPQENKAQQKPTKVARKKLCINQNAVKNSPTSKDHSDSQIIRSKGNGQLKSKTVTKMQHVKDVSQNKSKISCIPLANKLRKSTHSPTNRFSLKYVFKSTKKSTTQQMLSDEYEYQEKSNLSPQNRKQIGHSHAESQLNSRVMARREELEDQDSIFLCAATPPRRKPMGCLE